MDDKRCPKCGAREIKLGIDPSVSIGIPKTVFECGTYVPQNGPIYECYICTRRQLNQAHDEIHGLNESLATMESKLETCKRQLQVAQEILRFL